MPGGTSQKCCVGKGASAVQALVPPAISAVVSLSRAAVMMVVESDCETSVRGVEIGPINSGSWQGWQLRARPSRSQRLAKGASSRYGR